MYKKKLNLFIEKCSYYNRWLKCNRNIFENFSLMNVFNFIGL